MNEVSIAALDPTTLERIRTMWARLAGAHAFPEEGKRIITNPASQICPSGWSGVVAIGDGIIATVPDDSRRERLTSMLHDLAANDDWSSAYSHALEVRGPARLAYLDRRVLRFHERNAPACEFVSVDDEDVAAFLTRVPSADRDEAGIEACSAALACVRDDGGIVAAAGYRVWLGIVAHMSVLVAPHHRAIGLATTVARAATRRAVDHDLTPQWRAGPAASQAVARKIGYLDLGQQLSIRLS